MPAPGATARMRPRSDDTDAGDSDNGGDSGGPADAGPPAAQSPARTAKRARTAPARDTDSSANADPPADARPAAARPPPPPACTNTTLPDTLAFPPAPPAALKLVSWNVAGLRSALGKGFPKYLDAEDADVVCLQETKLNEPPKGDTVSKKKYPHQFWSHCKTKKGYSGVAVLSKIKPLSVRFAIGDKELDDEGRFIIAEFADFFFVGCYILNAGAKLERLDLKQRHYVKLVAFLEGLQAQKPVVWTGDLNVAHHEIDLARPKTNTKSAGFTPEERRDFGNLLEKLDMVDTFRSLYPDAAGQYTYFSYRFGARSKGIGWRLDYFVVSRALMPRVLDSTMRAQVWGASDHVPIVMLLGPGEASASGEASGSASASVAQTEE